MTRRARITNSRPAGEDHAVLTVEGGSVGHRRTPCPGCPWRRENTGNFPAEAFRHSANTAYDAALHVFACHESGAEKPHTCAGFLLKNAANNLGVRLKHARGEIGRVSADGADLFGSYREMAIANGVAPDDPVLAPCRANNERHPDHD